MKKVLVILTMVCAAFAVQAQTKVGHINSSLLIESMPEADSIQKKLGVEQEQWKNIVDDKDREMRSKYAAYIEISEDPSVNKTLKEIKMQEVEKTVKKKYQGSVTDENYEQLKDDYLDEIDREMDQDDEENDLSRFKGDDENGDYEGHEEEDLGYLD